MASRDILFALAVLALTAPAALAQPVDFGDDSSDYANDTQCDDPRFTGEGMATGLSQENVMADASDCTKLFSAGMIRLVRTKEQSNVSECASINYGDDSSQWAKDRECDDPRFTGTGVDGVMLMEDLMTDATDCRTLCESGDIWLR